jgi:inhibitor of KinA sporulation pathway (predicted exonuclease)
LTGIEQTNIDKANPLVDALLELASWLKKAQVNAWGSWGMFDRSQFIMECRLKNLENPLANLQHFNIKQLFARKFDHRVGLVRAVTMRGLTFEGRAHSGISDATNIARLLAKEHLLREAVLQRVSCERFCHE